MLLISESMFSKNVCSSNRVRWGLKIFFERNPEMFVPDPKP
jgi:hypothetical protein